MVSNNLEVFLIRSPVHRLFLESQNESLFQEILNKDFSDINFLDFSSFPIEDEYFYDTQHLNAEGALLFSQWLNDNILELGI